MSVRRQGRGNNCRQEHLLWFPCEETGFPGVSVIIPLPMQEMPGWSLGQEDLMEEEITHSSILAWKIAWTEEPSRLQSIEWQRVGHD